MAAREPCEGFDIRVEHVPTKLIPGRAMDGWGFNGSILGPTMQVTEGDRMRLNVEHRLTEPFSITGTASKTSIPGRFKSGRACKSLRVTPVLEGQRRTALNAGEGCPP